MPGLRIKESSPIFSILTLKLVVMVTSLERSEKRWSDRWSNVYHMVKIWWKPRSGESWDNLSERFILNKETTVNVVKFRKRCLICVYCNRFKCDFYPRYDILARYLLSSHVRHVYHVCLSVTIRSCTKTAKHRMTQTTRHDSPETVVLWWLVAWHSGRTSICPTLDDAADGWPLMSVNRPQQGQRTRPTQPFILSRTISEYSAVIECALPRAGGAICWMLTE